MTSDSKMADSFDSWSYLFSFSIMWNVVSLNIIGGIDFIDHFWRTDCRVFPLQIDCNDCAFHRQFPYHKFL